MNYWCGSRYHTASRTGRRTGNYHGVRACSVAIRGVRHTYHRISLNAAAKIQTAAIKNDMTIRNREKLYSFPGLSLS